MKRLFSTRILAAAGVAVCALAATTAAQARTDVFLSLGIPGPVYVEPAPVYVQPRPVYVQPQPVYVQPQVYGTYGNYGNYRGYDDRRVYNVYEQRDGWQHRRHGHRYGPWGDLDRDGVPNRYDHAPQNPYRR